MKRTLVLFVLLIILLLCCGCGRENKVTAYENGFSSDVEIKTSDNAYKYKLTYGKDGKCTFVSVSGGSVLSFGFNNGKNHAAHNGFSIDLVAEEVSYNYPAIIKNMLDCAYKNEVTADYNGIYCAYNTSDYGEYKLFLEKSGMPHKLIIKSGEISVYFSNLKELKV